ncbi:hypothetical protein KDA23_05865 [Candidatus Saccharibacteria bacterium]|nr:hypothetical protein [Candidatus Saccharibacteria bacterium]
MEDTRKHYWLYVLLLEQDKYYVGITAHKNPETRIAEHKRGVYGARWTKDHHFVETIEIVDLGSVTRSEAENIENRCTYAYMKSKGYQNVRGGKFNYSGKYRRVGPWFWRDQDFSLLLAFILMLVAIVAAWNH